MLIDFYYDSLHPGFSKLFDVGEGITDVSFRTGQGVRKQSGSVYAKTMPSEKRKPTFQKYYARAHAQHLSISWVMSDTKEVVPASCISL